MPPKGWKRDQKSNLDKQAEVAEKVTPSVKKTDESLQVTTVEPPKSEPPKKEATPQNTTGTERKRLPKVLITYYDKDGQLQMKEYVCYNLRSFVNTTTDLEGAQPTKRKDKMYLSIEADVVDVN